MRIHTQFNDELLARASKRRTPPSFVIVWEENQIFYPGKAWFDNGTIILGWWLMAAQQLARGEFEKRFAFMEGPYALKAKLIHGTGELRIEPDGLDMSWSVKFTEFVELLIKATEVVCTKLKEFTGFEKERAILLKGSDELKTEISKWLRKT